MNEPRSIVVELPPRRGWVMAALVAVALFAAVVPTLTWTQLNSGNENIVVQTALEMRNGGPKLLPRMMGEPRVKKPPLVAWLTAASMRPATIDRLDDPDQREAAYTSLAFQARWPALIAGCVLVLATFEFARVWAGAGVGLAAAMVVATNYLTLKYMRQSTTDAHLTAWVAVANACLLHGLLRGRWWPAATGGAVAVGLAFLCKGPVALVETLAPTIVAAVVLYGRRGDAERRRPVPWRALLVGVLLFAAIALPWFVYVLWNVPAVAATWTSEVSREGATTLDAGRPWTYLLLGPATVPWCVFGLVGLLMLWQCRRVKRAWVPFIFAVTPLLIMVWFRDRKERYMLPMIVPAAVICGYGLAAWVRGWQGRRTWIDRLVLAGHAATVLVIAIGLPVAGLTLLRTIDDRPWYSASLVGWAVVAAVAFVGFIGVLARRWAWAVPVGTFVMMLGVSAFYLHGYRDSEDGRSPLKPLADAIRTHAPNAAVYDWLPRGRADEQIAIYLNRTILRQDPAAVVPLDRPIVFIARQGKLDPPPDFAPPWRRLAEAREGTAVWSAWVLKN